MCRNFGEDDHTIDKTDKCSNESKCSNYGEGHMAGSSNYKIEIKERVIKKCKLIAEWGDKEISNPDKRR